MTYLLTSVAVMALTTYALRMLPLVLLRKKIKSRFFKSVLFYIPYAVLCAMTIPWIFYEAANPIAASCGFLTALILSYFKKSLIVVAFDACSVAFLVGLIPIAF